MDYLLMTVEAHARFLDGKLKVVGVHLRAISGPVTCSVEDISKGLSSVDRGVIAQAYFIRFTMPVDGPSELQTGGLDEEARKNGLDPVELQKICEEAWIQSVLKFIGFDVHYGGTCGAPASQLTLRSWQSDISVLE